MIVSGTPYRFRELQELEISIKADSEKHYSDSGVKKKISSGDSSTWRIRIKNTADLYDTVTPPVTPRLISYMIAQIMGAQLSGGPTPPQRSLPLFLFEGVNLADSASTTYIHYQINGYVEEITKDRPEGAGTEDLIMSGEIQSFVEALSSPS